MDFRIRQEKFEGPLGLLLEMIEGEKLSINEVSLAKVADEYVRYVQSLEQPDPEELGEFLVIAAQLALIKSRSLLPHLALKEEEQGSIQELQERLALYQQIRERAKALAALVAEKRWIVSREAYQTLQPVFYPPPRLSTERLRAAFAAFLAALPRFERLVEERLQKIVSLEEKIAHIRSFLQDRVERAFSEIVRGAREKVEVIVSFLAILELARQKFVALEQREPFADIIVRRM